MVGRKDLQELYQDFEISRLKIIDMIAEDIALERVRNGEERIIGVPGGYAQWNGKVLKLHIPDYIPSKKTVGDIESKLYAETRSHWRSMIFSIYKTLGVELKFNKVHCHIALFLPYAAPWDIDNRIYSFIINGIRSCRILVDDSYKYFEFSIGGFYDRTNPHTEIYITESNNINLYNLLNQGF